MKLNLPNRITVIRMLSIPIFSLFISADLFGGGNNCQLWSRIISALLFIAASLTDMLDGKIARKRGLVTDFGKFLDPLADKFLIFSAMFAICVSPYIFPDGYLLSADAMKQIFFWCSVLVIFRELAVTSMRLVVASSGVVVAASWIAKIKTVSQMVCISVIIIEPIILPFARGVASIICMLVMVFFTLKSGYDYLKTYWKYLN